MAACFQTFVAKGHASALLQLAVRCDSGSLRFISIGEGRKEGRQEKEEKARARQSRRADPRETFKEEENEADAPPHPHTHPHAVLKKTPPPYQPPSQHPPTQHPPTLLLTALHLLCLVLSPPRRELSLLRASGRRVIVETRTGTRRLFWP